MIKRVLVGLLLLIVIGVVAFVFWAQEPEIAAISPPAARSFDPAAVSHGAQLAAMGNCSTCHTSESGAPFAGGRALATPFGTIYATNITPDPDSGIGRWSLAAFRRAMRQGVDRTGRHLYPAFPYDHFTKLDDGDIAAIYAFLMTRDPVRAEAKRNDLPFPLDNRLMIAGWKLLFFRSGAYRNDPAHDETWNRGAYLVNGLAHCGACHTPRNALGAEQRGQYLGGGSAEGWHAPALNAKSAAPVRWTAEALFTYLRTGTQPEHGAAAGPMAPVARNLATAPESDVRAIAGYVASIDNRPAQDSQQKTTDLVTRTSAGSDAERAAAKADPTSAAIYAGACATCHSDARSGPSGALDLALSGAVNGPDPRNAIRVVLDGIHPAAGRRGPIMPGFADALTDQQIAGLLAYVRARFSAQPGWGNLQDHVHRVREGGEQG